MNASKPLTLAASILIACAGIAGIRAYANASVNAVLPAAVGGARAQVIRTLPTITVRPSRVDYERAFGKNAAGQQGIETGTLGGTDFGMPYYSFAVQPTVVAR